LGHCGYIEDRKKKEGGPTTEEGETEYSIEAGTAWWKKGKRIGSKWGTSRHYVKGIKKKV